MNICSENSPSKSLKNPSASEAHKLNETDEVTASSNQLPPSLPSVSDVLEHGKVGLISSKRSPAGVSGLFGAALRDLKKVKQQSVAPTDHD